MQWLPVLDVLGGVAVHGIGGQREAYRPVVSQIAPGADPLILARGYRTKLCAPDLYLADLDAILYRKPNSALYQQLTADGTRLWLDAGYHVPDELPDVPQSGQRWIIGLETWADPATLPLACQRCGTESLVFSVDLREGRSCGGPAWPDDPERVIETVLAAGLSQLIVLDLTDVGRSTGGSTQTLCQFARRIAPQATLIAGGGVRGPEDVARWEALGIDWLLVGTALHEGRLDDGMSS